MKQQTISSWLVFTGALVIALVMAAPSVYAELALMIDDGVTSLTVLDNEVGVDLDSRDGVVVFIPLGPGPFEDLMSLIVVGQSLGDPANPEMDLFVSATGPIADTLTVKLSETDLTTEDPVLDFVAAGNAVALMAFADSLNALFGMDVDDKVFNFGPTSGAFSVNSPPDGPPPGPGLGPDPFSVTLTATLTGDGGNVDFGFSGQQPPGGECSLDVTKTCLVPASTDDLLCTDKIAATLLQYIGPNIESMVTVEFKGDRHGQATYELEELLNGTILQMGDWTIDARPDDLGSKTTVTIGGEVQEVIHTSCSAIYVAGEPAPLDARTGEGVTKGDPSPNWFVLGFAQKNGTEVTTTEPVPSTLCEISGPTTVTYGYKVTNTGATDVTVTAVDDVLGSVFSDVVLSSGGMVSGTLETLVDGEDGDTLINTVTATGVPVGGGASCLATASAEVNIVIPPVSCADGKPQTLVFEYTGLSCAASNNSQGTKAKCADTAGGPNGTEPVSIMYTGKDADNKVAVDPTDGTMVGDLVTLDAFGRDRLHANSKLEVKNGGLLQKLEIHTSCSQPLVVGDVFGSLILREFIPKN